MNVLLAMIKNICFLTQHINDEPSLDRVLARTIKYTSKLFNFGFLFNNAVERQKTFKRLIGNLKNDEEVTTAEDFAEIWEQFLESLCKVYNTEASEMEKDFVAFKKFLAVQKNLLPDNLLPEVTKLDKVVEAFKKFFINQEKLIPDNLLPKLKRTGKHKSHKKTKPSKNHDPMTPKWETLGRKLNFLSNKDTFHDEIEI